jgi:rhodanese-related sulfurtransferase
MMPKTEGTRMSWLDSIKKVLAKSEPDAPVASEGAQPANKRDTERKLEEIRVPEITPVELMERLRDAGDRKPLLLDCRESYERRQGYIPGSLHIPMNTIPQRLSEIDGWLSEAGAQLGRATPLVVYCAHGNRSYGVTGWLIDQGYQATSLKGGIVDWQARGGEVTR